MAQSTAHDAVPAPRAAFGAVAGALAFLLNYVLAYILWIGTSFPETVGGVIREFVTGQVSDPVFAGWLLYGAHSVAIEIPGLMTTNTQNAITLVDQPTTSLLYLTVPLVLLTAGVALSRAHGASTLSDGAIAGSFTTLGYFPLVAIGAFVFATTTNGATAKPAFAPAMALAGLVYPTIMGALGGALVTLVD